MARTPVETRKYREISKYRCTAGRGGTLGRAAEAMAYRQFYHLAGLGGFVPFATVANPRLPLRPAQETWADPRPARSSLWRWIRAFPARRLAPRFWFAQASEVLPLLREMAAA